MLQRSVEGASPRGDFDLLKDAMPKGGSGDQVLCVGGIPSLIVAKLPNRLPCRRLKITNWLSKGHASKARLYVTT